MKTKSKSLKNQLKNFIAGFLVATLAACSSTSPVGSPRYAAYPSLPASQVEDKIRMQAIGAGIGTGIMYTFIKGGDRKDYLKNGAIGGLVSGLIGEVMVRNARGQMVKTTRLQQMVDGARQYNAQALAYNRGLTKEISSIRSKSASERSRIASSRKKSAENSRDAIQETINQRISVVNELNGKRQESSSLQETIRPLQDRKKELDRAIITLSSFEGPRV